MKCVILQPSYIPWRGYFHQIKKADLFIFYDCVEYDKGGWRNRNRIKTRNGSVWLTIPIARKGLKRNRTPIREIEISNHNNWAIKHLKTIRQTYRKAPFFDQYEDLIESFYQAETNFLADLTIPTTIELSKALAIHDTDFICSSELDIPESSQTDRLIHILQEVEATHYITGPSAADYIESEKFEAAGIDLEYMAYDYPEYDQLHPPYDPYVSILDLLFTVGEDAGSYIWG